MLGLERTNSANASLLNNFEIVATSLIAFAVFREKLSKRLTAAIVLVTLASVALSFEGKGSFQFNTGSLLVLGFVAYGLSINFYIKAQKNLGAAKTSAYYSVAPFFGVLFGVIMLHERPEIQFYVGLAVMIGATVLMVKDTIVLQHTHAHSHSHTHQHAHGDLVHSHEHTHVHSHTHIHGEDEATHSHTHETMEDHEHQHTRE